MKAILVALTLSTAFSTSAHSEEPRDEIVVTAQRREQKLEDVPISVSVLSGDELARRRALNLEDVQYGVPNVVIAPSQTSRATASVAMRGHYERDSSPTVDSPVGIYLDGVYVARSVGANLELFDIERVEVMRGPQGTLFGRNAIGGAIQLVPRRPGADYEALLSGGGGNFDRYDASFVMNAPTGRGNGALRVAVARSGHGGYAHSTLNDRDIGDEDTNFARAQLTIAPGDSWDLNLSSDYTETIGGSQWMTLIGAFPPAMPIPGSQGHPDDSLANYMHPFADQTAVNRAGRTHSLVWGASATLTAPLAHGTFKSISAYRALDIDAVDSDQDGTPYDISAITFRHDDQEQLSEELQWYGAAFTSRLDWIGGLYYFEENGTFTQHFPMLAPLTFDPVESRPWGEVHNQSFAAYAQATYALTPRLRLTAGARYNVDRRQLMSRNSLRRGGVETCRLDSRLLDEPGICQATRPQREFRYVPFTFGFEYTPADSTLLYAKVSSGQRAGGYNLRGATAVDLDAFGPESVTAYEVGAKSELIDRRLRINLALFSSDFDDIQLVANEVTTNGAGQPFATSVIRNGGAAQIRGGELEVSALAGRMEITATFGLTDAKYIKLDPRAADLTLDSNFIMTPKMNASLAFDWPATTKFGRIDLHGDYAWRDDVAFWYDRDTLARQSDYGLLNARIAAHFDASNLELSLWGRNLTDEHYFVRAFESTLVATGMPGDPRTYGVALNYRFAQR